MEAVILNDEQLQERLAYWQEKLKLQDWEIQAKIKRERDMREGCAGCVNWVIHNKQAVISLLDPVDYPENLIGAQDMESTLVHELMHLHLAPIAEDHGDDEHYNLFEEWAINAVVDALIALERK